jgi:hypothetical protein
MSSSVVLPDAASLDVFFSRSYNNTELTTRVCQRVFWSTFCCFLWSLRTSSTSSLNEAKPSDCSPVRHKESFKAGVRTSRAERMWSGAIVFLDSFSQISFASDETRWMNSTARRISPARADGWAPNHLHNTR